LLIKIRALKIKKTNRTNLLFLGSYILELQIQLLVLDQLWHLVRLVAIGTHDLTVICNAWTSLRSASRRILERVYCCGAASSWKGISKSTVSATCVVCSRPRKVIRVTITELKAASRMARSAWAVTTVPAARMTARSWLRDIQNNDVMAITD